MCKKIYKFRPLGSEIDFCRLKKIIETGKFKCSSFQELNDPMEGVFSILEKEENEEYSKNIKTIIDKIYSDKMKYKICAFSGKSGFENPAIWGYYTGGFKGVAIEVGVKKNEDKKYFEKMDYNDGNFWLNSIEKNDSKIIVEDKLIKKILTHKKKAWEHEDEYRFLAEKDDNSILKKSKNCYYYFAKIGKITAIYFGNPYGNAENKNEIKEKNDVYKKYECFKEEIIKIAKDQKN